MITAKFGGTSLCDAAHFQMVRDILALKEERRFVVVSAPGKRFPEDIKITDQLYRCHEEARQGGNVAEAFTPVASRFQEIAAQLGLSLDLEEEFRATLWAMERGAGQDFCASRGEYFSARIMAALLNLPFLDPAQCIFFDEKGQFDGEAAQKTLAAKLQDLPGAVMPGFYGGMPDGAVATFSRGGSDISGAVLARASGSRVYENWTDVSGVLAADPRVIAAPPPIATMTYAEVRELAYLGATVLHEDAIYPAKAAGIPIHICNTMDPQAPGSWPRPRSLPGPSPAWQAGGATPPFRWKRSGPTARWVIAGKFCPAWRKTACHLNTWPQALAASAWSPKRSSWSPTGSSSFLMWRPPSTRTACKFATVFP